MKLKKKELIALITEARDTQAEEADKLRKLSTHSAHECAITTGAKAIALDAVLNALDGNPVFLRILT
jgi:hypothetical protein